MLQLTWLFVGVVALLTTVGALRSGYDTATRLIAGAFAMVLWAVWAFGAYSVEVVSHGEQFVYGYPQLAYVGFAGAVIMFLFVIRLAFALLRDDAEDRTPGDMDPTEGL